MDDLDKTIKVFRKAEEGFKSMADVLERQRNGEEITDEEVEIVSGRMFLAIMEVNNL